MSVECTESLFSPWFTEVCREVSEEINSKKYLPPKPLLFRTIGNNIDFQWLSKTPQDSNELTRVKLKQKIEKIKPHLLKQQSTKK